MGKDKEWKISKKEMAKTNVYRIGGKRPEHAGSTIFHRKLKGENKRYRKLHQISKKNNGGKVNLNTGRSMIYDSMKRPKKLEFKEKINNVASNQNKGLAKKIDNKRWNKIDKKFYGETFGEKFINFFKRPYRWIAEDNSKSRFYMTLIIFLVLLIALTTYILVFR